jgi:hypothetical protein
MESTVPRRDARERLHRRALSQASTASTMNTHRTTKSTSTSSCPRVTTPSNAPHTHRYHHSQCVGTPTGTGTRPPPRLSREPSQESKQPMAPASNLLQERLQQERRAESDRLADKYGSDLGSSTGGTRDGDMPSSSSRKYVSSVERRPKSSHGDDSSQSSMGAKQIEKVCEGRLLPSHNGETAYD